MRINGKSRITGKYGAFDRKMDRKKEQIQERWESGKASLYRRGRADSVTRLGSNLSVGEAFSACVSSSHLSYFIGISELKRLCFYKKSSGYFYFFPASGYRNYNDGILNASGTNGYGWTSTPYNSSNAWNLNFNSGNANMNNNNRGNGFPVRCVQASAPVFVFIKNTFVFFPAAGIRNSNNGSLANSGTEGDGWTSVPSGSGNAYRFILQSGDVSVGNTLRTFGFAVRCVQASAAVGIASIKNTEQIRFRRESGKASLCRRGQADSVTCLGRKLSVGHSFLPCAASSYLFPLIKLLVFKSLYFYKYSSGYSLFFPASGYRHYNDGKLNSSGTNGYAWSSTLSGGKAYNLTFNSGGANLHLNENRGHGFSVRCVQASAAVFAFAKDTFVFFPATGYRGYDDGKLIKSGTWGYEWVSTLGVSGAWGLDFSPAGLGLYDFPRSCGFPVRCVQASAAVFAFSNDTFCFFPASGYRHFTDGKRGGSGALGYGWTLTPGGGNNAWYLDFFSSYARVNNYDRGHGFTVRCVQASATVFAFSNDTFVFFPAAGIRNNTDGSLTNSGIEGDGWTSVPDGNNAFRLIFKSGYAYVTSVTRMYGFPVRCVQASAAVFAFIKETFVFFPATGYRHYSNGGFYNSGTWGYWWTSTPGNDGKAWRLHVQPGASQMVADWCTYGFPVRCVQASAAVFSGIENDLKQIRFRRESGKVRLCRRGRADSVTRLGRKLSAGNICLPGAAPSHVLTLIRILLLIRLCFYKHSSGYSLFFPATGYRNYNDGSLRDTGKEGDGWTSTPSGNNGSYLRFLSGIAHVNNNNRGNGFPVRCVQASATVFAAGVNKNQIINVDETVM